MSWDGFWQVNNGLFDTAELPINPRDRFVFEKKFKDGDSSLAFAQGLDYIDVRVPEGHEIFAASRMLPNGDGRNPRVYFGSESTQYRARMTWTSKAWQLKEVQFGTAEAEARDPKSFTRHLNFTTPFDEPPEIIVWVQKLKFSWNSKWQLQANVSNVTTDGFDIETSGNSIKESIFTWVAVKKGKRNVAVGSWPAGSGNTREVKFPKGKFKNPPTVLTGINRVDADSENGIKVFSMVDHVTKDGFTWKMVLGTERQHGADYIAISNG